MRLLLSLLLLALALPFSGCRDSLVDPIDDPAATDPPPVEVTSPYFKGPTEMEVGSSGTFRVEYVEGAASYDWTVEDYSTGLVQGTFSADDAGLERQFNAVATESGTVTLFVVVKGEDGDALASVSKTIAISPH